MMQREASYAFYVKTRLFGWVLLFVFGTTGALSGVNLSWAAKEKKGSKIKVDYLALAAVLLRDGHPDRALNAIVKVDLQSKEMKPKAKRIQYYTLFGVIRLKRKEFLKAAPLFEQAIKAGETKPLVHLLLAQCYFRLTFYKRAVVAL
jgi:predicted Zn-dependent protease